MLTDKFSKSLMSELAQLIIMLDTRVHCGPVVHDTGHIHISQTTNSAKPPFIFHTCAWFLTMQPRVPSFRNLAKRQLLSNIFTTATVIDANNLLATTKGKAKSQFKGRGSQANALMLRPHMTDRLKLLCGL